MHGDSSKLCATPPTELIPSPWIWTSLSHLTDNMLWKWNDFWALQFPPRPLATLTVGELGHHAKSLTTLRPPHYEEAQASMWQNHGQREMPEKTQAQRPVSEEAIRWVHPPLSWLQLPDKNKWLPETPQVRITQLSPVNPWCCKG